MWQKKTFLLLIVLLLILALSACTPNGGNGDPDPDPPEITTLADIALGDPADTVTQMYGTQYEEDTTSADESYYGEDVANWNYQDRIYFTIGLTTQSVLRVYVAIPDYETNLGVKVGDKADTFLPQYRDYYDELVSNQSDDILNGWFLIEEGGLLIFRFADENGELDPTLPIPDEAVVDSITLAYVEHFD